MPAPTTTLSMKQKGLLTIYRLNFVLKVLVDVKLCPGGRPWGLVGSMNDRRCSRPPVPRAICCRLAEPRKARRCIMYRRDPDRLCGGGSVGGEGGAGRGTRGLGRGRVDRFLSPDLPLQGALHNTALCEERPQLACAVASDSMRSLQYCIASSSFLTTLAGYGGRTTRSMVLIARRRGAEVMTTATPRM